MVSKKTVAGILAGFTAAVVAGGIYVDQIVKADKDKRIILNVTTNTDEKKNNDAKKIKKVLALKNNRIKKDDDEKKTNDDEDDDGIVYKEEDLFTFDLVQPLWHLSSNNVVEGKENLEMNVWENALLGDFSNLSPHNLWSILTYLSPWELVNLQNVCKSWNNVMYLILHDKSYKYTTAFMGFPEKIRGKIWKLYVDTSVIKRDEMCKLLNREGTFGIKGKITILIKERKVKNAIDPLSNFVGPKTKKIHFDNESQLYNYFSKSEINEKEWNIIKRDIPRTLIHYPFFPSKDAANTALGNVLKAISNANESVGYCQGMNFLFGFALTKQSEQDSFVMINNFLTSPVYNFGLMYEDGLSYLHTLLGQCERLLKIYLPALSKYFKMHYVETSLFTEWYLTLFTYKLPLPFVTRIWDLFIVEGWDAIHKVALAIIYLNKDNLLHYNFEDIVRYIKDFTHIISIDDILEASRKFNFENINFKD